MKTRKPLPTEVEILQRLKRGEVKLPPFKIDIRLNRQDLDATVTLSWQEREYLFGAEIKRLWTPKAVAAAIDEVQRKVASRDINPLIIVPYLNEQRLAELEARNVSGMDLCGNGIVLVPGELFVYRTGSPNRFRWEGTIKNVYRWNSSMVARVFLLAPEFASVQDVLEEVLRRGGELTLSTVSKVCTGLESDLVIERNTGKGPVAPKLRLLQPGKLLDLLAENYVPPEISRTYSGKFAGTPQALIERVLRWEKPGGVNRAVLTGATSVEAYAVMGREPVQSFYCSNLSTLVRNLGEDVKETDRFANVTFLQTQEDFVYFDRRPGLVASPIQTYLELATGEKRERETAEQVRRLILNQIG